MQKTGATISVLILLYYIVLNKWINSLNRLILQLQFFAYISTWQIRFTDLIEDFLKEIKRIVLAEYFDDFSLSKEIMNEFFGDDEGDMGGNDGAE